MAVLDTCRPILLGRIWVPYPPQQKPGLVDPRHEVSLVGVQRSSRGWNLVDACLVVPKMVDSPINYFHHGSSSSLFSSHFLVSCDR
jgi:hypothetical protein